MHQTLTRIPKNLSFYPKILLFHADFPLKLRKKFSPKRTTSTFIFRFSLLPPPSSISAAIDAHLDSNSATLMVLNKEKLWSRAWRWAKTLFFVANMLASLFFVCAPPLFVVFLDLLIPSVLLAAATGGPGGTALSVQLRSYGFGTSFVDLPLLSAARSLLLLGFYLCWSGQGPYLGAATVCAAVSTGYVSLKAITMFGAEAVQGTRHLWLFREKEGAVMEALLLSSFALAVGHLVAAYRTSCRERRKLLVYKIDIEAVSVYHNDFTNYHKIALS